MPRVPAGAAVTQSDAVGTGQDLFDRYMIADPTSGAEMRHTDGFRVVGQAARLRIRHRYVLVDAC